MINNFFQTLQTLYPNVVTLADTTAYDKDGNEVQYDIASVQALVDAAVYREQRAAEYPPIGDQLDALWKGGDAAAEMLAKVQAVKDKYPKPIG